MECRSRPHGLRDIHRLPPGHLLHFADGEVQVRRYTTLPIEPPLLLKHPQEYVDQFRTLPIKPSPIVSQRAHRHPHERRPRFHQHRCHRGHECSIARSPLNLRAYTTDYKPLFPDEEDYYADLVAEKFSIPLDVSLPRHVTPLRRLRFPAPTRTVPRSLLRTNRHHYRRIAAHSRVLLSGYGGDDILIGQAWPHLLHLFRQRKFGQHRPIFGGYILKHRRSPRCTAASVRDFAA